MPCRPAAGGQPAGLLRDRAAGRCEAFPHHGEEECLRGWAGSGTIFFSNCSLRCVFCQNFAISHEGDGRPVTAEQLADTMLHLQKRGCHNINLVTPSHVVPQILEALRIAAPAGLRLPLVYNTGGYDRLETLRWLDGVMDIYLPDFKFWKPETAHEFADAPDYPDVARAAVKECTGRWATWCWTSTVWRGGGCWCGTWSCPRGWRRRGRFCVSWPARFRRRRSSTSCRSTGRKGWQAGIRPSLGRWRREFQEALAFAREAGLRLGRAERSKYPSHAV